MDCTRCDELLIDYYFGELDRASSSAITEHLAGCGQCAIAHFKLHDSLRHFDAVHRQAPRAQVHQKLRQQVARQFRPPWYRRLLRLSALPIPAYQTVLLLLGVLLIWTLLGRGGPLPGFFPRTSGSPSTLIEAYDASRPVQIDRHLL